MRFCCCVVENIKTKDNMKTNYNPTTIALVFFAGTFLLAFTTEDTTVAAIRIVSYFCLTCLLTVAVLFKKEIKSFYQNHSQHQLNNILTNAENFSKEYGDIYLMADNLKRQRKIKKEVSVNRK